MKSEKEKVESARKFVSQFVPLAVNYDAACEIALINIDTILANKPTYSYWDTHNDELPSAETYWNEIRDGVILLKNGFVICTTND